MIGVGILAGGKSSRMGEDKALLRIGNERIIDRIVKQFIGSPEIMISCADKGDYGLTGITVVADEKAGIGPLEGLRRILTETECDHVFVCAVDMPFVKKKKKKYLEQFISSEYDAYVFADEEHIHPLCAIYSTSILPVIGEVIASGNYRIREVLNRVRTKYIDITLSGLDPKTVSNINTQEEYLDIEQTVFRCRSYSSG